MTEIGDRVVAIRNANKQTKTVYIFGYGVYDGMQLMPDDMIHPMFGNTRAETESEYRKMFKDKMGELVPYKITEELFCKIMQDCEENPDTKMDAIDKMCLDLYIEERSRPRLYYNEDYIKHCVDKYRTNPCITLDNGNVVWGCECWWGPVDQIDDYLIDGYIVEQVNKND